MWLAVLIFGSAALSNLRIKSFEILCSPRGLEAYSLDALEARRSVKLVIVVSP